MKLVQWGAGNIGRSFIGQVFARSGYEVIFIDIDSELIELLNKGNRYEVLVTSQEGTEKITIEGVSAIYGSDQQQINESVLHADIMSVSVGKQVLPKIAGQIAEAVFYRYQHRRNFPIDIIIAENIHDGARFLEGLLAPYLPGDFPLRDYIGLVETSIGKMVPLQTGDTPLIVISEPYNRLIADKEGFLNPIPECKFLQPVSPIRAYVERKLYIHNLGHAAAAYLGYKEHPETLLLAEVLEDDSVLEGTRESMEQAAEILLARYPEVFTHEKLSAHINDLLYRFQNRAMGDTVFRVGRDLRRKLRCDDRLMGAIVLAEKNMLQWDSIGRVYLAAFWFKAADPKGNLFLDDEQLRNEMADLCLEDKIRFLSCFDEEGVPAAVQDRIIQRFITLSLEEE